MLKKRLIPVLILREGLVVQSVQFKHTNIIHWKPLTAVDCFNRWAVDEIVVLDVTRNLNTREKFYEVISGLSNKCFVPMSVGGWIDSIDEIRKLLRLGADKVILNTHAFHHPEFIQEAAQTFGTQCIVISIDSKLNDIGDPEVYIDRGQQPTGIHPATWAEKAAQHGAGEIFLNSIDHDGNRKGYNLALIEQVSGAVDIPVIAMGGVFKWDHLVEGIHAGADAVAAANIFHYTEQSTRKAKKHLRSAGLPVR